MRTKIFIIILTASINIYAQNTLKNDNSDRIYYLSKNGAISDADLRDASKTFGTDNTAAIQNVLNQAKNGPVKVIWDGRYSVTGIKVYSNTTIEVWAGCGAILRDNSNYTLLENANFSFTTRKDSNITINGGIWNGNAPGQKIRMSGKVGCNCVWRFYGVYNLQLSNFSIIRQTTYALHAINVKKYKAENFLIDCGSSGVINADGIHADGNCEDVIFRDGTITAHDDAIGLNADDLWRWADGSTYPYYPADAAGPINNVLIENITLKSQLFGIRILSGSSRIDNIKIKGVKGFTSCYAFVIDNYWGAPQVITHQGPGNIGTVSIEDVNVEIKSAMYGTNIHNSVLNVDCCVENLILKNFHRNNFELNNLPTIYIAGEKTKIKNLNIDGYNSYDSASTNTTPHVYNEGTITNLKISNANIYRNKTANESPLLYMKKGNINCLQLNNISCNNILNVVKIDTGAVNNISASSIIHSGGQAILNTNKNVIVNDFVLSNFTGNKQTSGEGKILKLRGDGFMQTVPKKN